MLGTLFVDGSELITVDQWLVEKLNGWTIWEGFPIGNLILVIMSIVLTVLLSSVIGTEREMRGRSAGLRTHLLVAVGSAIVMIISIYGFPVLPGNWSRDPARLAAQVVTGIGFLGAGAIIHNNGGIKGLTTASTIWLAMAIGLACGSMNFILAALGTAAVMVVLVSFRKVEQKLTRNHPVVIMIADAARPIMTDLLACAKKHDANISDIVTQIMNDGESEKIQITFRLSAQAGQNLDQESFVKDLKSTLGVIDIQVLNHH
ncbi:MAG: MgtC/SapB family protein [Erysipelotrichaceae bacterium]|jgi:uncharacterized membrane protein YhiD involved in acid resistance|nr:MgtC/SapB family protein [Erysipelotrichaceae bacterium]